MERKKRTMHNFRLEISGSDLGKSTLLEVCKKALGETGYFVAYSNKPHTLLISKEWTKTKGKQEGV